MIDAGIPAASMLQGRIRQARAKVRERPAPELIEPVWPGERSVWDFPRPPRVAPIIGTVEIRLGDHLVACSGRALEVLETSSPPVPYLPVLDVAGGELRDTEDWALCEWKGVSVFFDLHLPDCTVRKAGWSFPAPLSDLGQPYPLLKGRVAFFPSKFDCFWNGERVRPQAGGYYGGWITADLKGPFKGGSGTGGW